MRELKLRIWGECATLNLHGRYCQYVFMLIMPYCLHRRNKGLQKMVNQFETETKFRKKEGDCFEMKECDKIDFGKVYTVKNHTN